MKVSQKITSALMSLVLAVGLCPGAAYADSLAGVDLDAASISGEAEGAISVDASDGILQYGGLIQEAPAQTRTTLGAQSVPDYESFEAALLEAAENWDGKAKSMSIDVSSYDVYADQLMSLFRRFVNNNGQLFYLSHTYSYYVYPSGSNAQVCTFTLFFDTSYDSNDLTAFDAAVENALSEIEPDWNDEQKALYLHDWLVTHCEYDLTYSKYSAYNALVEGSAVCQGYSLAYDYLLKHAGVECDVITSDLINHAWNLATIGDATYYVDCTWDDPSNVHYEAYCQHGYFLRSRGEFGHIGQASGEIQTADGSTANDWLDTSGANVYENDSTGSSTSYDSAYWSDVVTPIPHVHNLWAYVDSTVASYGEAATIKVHDYAANSDSDSALADRELATIEPGYWQEWGKANSYYPKRYTSLTSNEESFLATTPTSLVEISTGGTATTAYTLTSAESATGYIYGVTYDLETETCHYELGTSLTEGPTGSGTFEFQSATKTCIANATVTVAPQVYAGTVLTPVVSVTLDGKTLNPGSDYVVTCPHTCTNVGDYTVTVVGEGDYRGWASGTFTISPKPVTVAARPASKTFGAADPQLRAAVTGLIDGDAIDYTLSRAPGEDAGSYDITASGDALQGNYEISYSPSTFKIKPASIGGATVTGVATKTYTGKAIDQNPVVKFGSTTLRKGIDYQLAFRGNTNAGTNTATVTITGKGNYTGSISKKFIIAKAANPMNVAAKTPKVKAKKKKAVKVKGSAAFKFKKKAIGAVTYKRVAKGSSKWLPKVNAKTGAITVKAGAREGTYKVKVKVTAKGNANYKAASKTLTVKVKVKVK